MEVMSFDANTGEDPIGKLTSGADVVWQQYRRKLTNRADVMWQQYRRKLKWKINKWSWCGVIALQEKIKLWKVFTLTHMAKITTFGNSRAEKELMSKIEFSLPLIVKFNKVFTHKLNRRNEKNNK